MIVPDLAPLATPVDRLQPLPGNPRRGDVDAVARSLAAFGQRKPVVAKRDGTVIAGNHTLAAARALGWPEVAVVWVDDDDTTAHAYALADNRTADLGGYDPAALAALIEEVRDADAALLAAVSYDEADLDDLLAAIQETAPTLIEHVSGPDHGAAGSHVDSSHTERLAHYQTKGVRSVVLDYPLDEYQRVAELAALVRTAWGIDSTAALFRELLERASP